MKLTYLSFLSDLDYFNGCEPTNVGSIFVFLTHQVDTIIGQIIIR